MINTNGVKIALDQLQQEMISAGLAVTKGLGMFGAFVFPYDDTGNPAEFSDATTAKSVIASHVATRPLTNDELNVKYASANDAGDRAEMHRLVAMAQGLVPRDRIPL